MGDSDPKSEKSDTPTRREETTANNKERLLWALEETQGLVYKACKLVDIASSTYYDYLKNDPAFAEAVKVVINTQIDEVEEGLLKMLHSDSEKIRIAASDIYLKAKAKDRGYGSSKQELSGEVGVKTSVIVRLPRNNREPD